MPVAVWTVLRLLPIFFSELPIKFQFWQRLCAFRHFIDSSLSFISLKRTWHIFYAFSPNVYYHDSLSQQLRAVWDLLLKIDLEGPTFISCTASSNFFPPVLRTSIACSWHKMGDPIVPARLNTGGWLSLTRQGLSPRKMCQAFLGATRSDPKRSLSRSYEFHT